MIYKLLSATEWAEAEAVGRFDGSAVDLRDGYLHFSAAEQVAETAAKHFAGQSGLLVLVVDPDLLGEPLRWEPSRGGALFPHLYRPLPVDAVVAVHPVPDGVDVADAVAAIVGT